MAFSHSMLQLEKQQATGGHAGAGLAAGGGAGTECPDCGKALTISNLNKHIKSVHKKLKKTCDICNEEVPYSSIRYSI